MIELVVVLAIGGIVAAVVALGARPPARSAGRSLAHERMAALRRGALEAVTTPHGPGVQMPDGRLVADSADPFQVTP